MKETKLYDDDIIAISLFKDNHHGVVVQMYRYTEQMIPNDKGGMQTKRNKSPLFTENVGLTKDKVLKSADAFKADVQLAIDKMYKEHQKIQTQDNTIDGVLNDYRSQNRKLND